MVESFKLLKKYEKILLLVFVVIEMALFTIVHLRLPGVTIYFQYASIVLCFAFAAIFAKKNILTLLISIGLFFTACADLVLLFFADYKILGLMFFCFVQVVYFMFILGQTNGKQEQINLWARGLAILVSEIVLWIIFKDIFNVLAGLVIFYFVNLLFNTVFALLNFKKNPLFAIGLVLFVLCDIFVGFGEMSLFFDVSSNAFFNFVYSIPFNIAWAFYIPSQILIALGIVKATRTKII